VELLPFLRPSPRAKGNIRPETPLRGATPHAARGWKSGIAILVGLIILAAIVNGSKNQNGAGVAPVEHSAGQQ
jgi:hypothetical protein